MASTPRYSERGGWPEFFLGFAVENVEPGDNWDDRRPEADISEVTEPAGSSCVRSRGLEIS